MRQKNATIKPNYALAVIYTQRKTGSSIPAKRSSCRAPIVAFIPFSLLIIAEKLRSDQPRRAALTLSAALSMILILITGLWLRGEYSSQLAAWKAAETLVDTGVEPNNIYGPGTWAVYHGAYEAWVAAGAPGFGTVPPGNPRIYDPLHDPFNSWLRKRNERAEYRIADSRQAPPPGRWQHVASYSFRSIRFRKHFVWTWKRASTP
jgi:hypothetical protein